MPDISSKRSRRKLPKTVQVAIFRRDAWLCCWCKRPVIFRPVMKLLELEIRNGGPVARLASYRLPGRREGSSWLDELGAAINHFGASSIGDALSNLCTSCSKCNARWPPSIPVDKWERRNTSRPIKEKCVDPKDWDGLASVFVMLADRNPSRLTVNEREWLKALRPTRATGPAFTNRRGNLADLAS